MYNYLCKKIFIASELYNGSEARRLTKLCKPKKFIMVALDDSGTILGFKCTLRDTNIDEEDVVGKNWFDLFIESSDREKVLEAFQGLLNDEMKKWKNFQHDLYIQGKHLLINFDNEVIIKNTQKIIYSTGIEYMDSL